MRKNMVILIIHREGLRVEGSKDFSFSEGFKFSWGPPEIIEIPKGVVPIIIYGFCST